MSVRESFFSKLKMLNEATLNANATSNTGKRHIQTYIDPFLPGKERHGSETHVLEKGHNDLPKGTKLTFKGKKTIGGKTHVLAVHSKSNKSVAIPISKIRKPSDKDGKHNEEHAVKRLWNHFSSGKGKGKSSMSLEDMHKEIDAAQTDRNHPLHIRNAEEHEFSGRISGNNTKAGTTESRKRAKQTYYNNLRDAAHTIHAMRNHPDFADHWKNGDQLEHAGKAKPKLSKHYTDRGVKGAGATSKGDALIIRSKGKSKGVKALSFKKTGGSQLMSSSPAEFHAIYSHAMKRAGIHSAEKEEVLKKARTHLEKGQHAKANKIIQGLHNKHPELIHHVTHEALSGQGKFASEDGRATHVAEIGTNAKVMTTKEFMKAHKEPIDRLRPRVRASKHGGVQSTVSLETPKLPKRQKKGLPMNIKENFYAKLEHLREEQLNELRGKGTVDKKEMQKHIRRKHDIAWEKTQRIRKEKKSSGPADTKNMDKYRNRLARMHNKLDK